MKQDNNWLSIVSTSYLKSHKDDLVNCLKGDRVNVSEVRKNLLSKDILGLDEKDVDYIISKL